MEEPKVSVGILFEEIINFELHGQYRLVSTGATFSGSHTAAFEQGQILFGGHLYGEMVFDPLDEDAACVELKNVVIGINFHWERKENQQFKGALKLIVENKKLAAINLIGIEAYLTSVISSEMRASSSPELLKAHAVISRSWLLAQIEKSRVPAAHLPSSSVSDEERIRWYDREDHTCFDVCADDHCQRYQGIIRQNSAVAVAVTATAGIVLEYDGRICDARFSKSCGGVTEKFENCWEPVAHEYLTVLRDAEASEEYPDLTDEATAEKWIRGNAPAFCNTHDREMLSQVLNDYDRETADFYRWKVEYTQDEITALIRQRAGLGFGNILDLIPIQRGTSGRLIRLKIVGTMRSIIIGKELEIRKTLSPSHLYSSAFVVDKEEGANGIPQKFILTGAGWGHGVGLCQIGAAVMSSRGFGFDAILLHYFKGASLVKRY